MAVMDIRFFSKLFDRFVSFKAIIPNDTPEYKKNNYETYYQRDMKTLYLLHGSGGDNSDWLYRTNIISLAEKYNLAIILPSGENSWYVDKNSRLYKYKKFIAEELKTYVELTFSLSSKREDNFIAGLSMGGYGALTIGLSYCDSFSKIVGLSSALIINDIGSSSPNRDIEKLNDFEFIFGDLKSIIDSEHNPEVLVKKAIENKCDIPKIYLACGNNDFLIEFNRDFRDFLKDHSVDCIYKEGEGIHDWIFWANWIEKSIKWLID